VACGGDSENATFSDGSPSGQGSEEPAPGENTVFTEDGATPKTDPYRGNPLCHVTPSTCMPDDDGEFHATGTVACATRPDAGAADAGASATARGCRIQKDRDASSIAPQCVSAAADQGEDGASCKTGEDCAPGFDCVEGPKGAVCRRYCCLGSCGAASANGGATFCDVQKLVDLNTKAPVCMPLKHCNLLTAGECSDAETCAVVSDTGETGCVAVGSAQVGDACDEAHCSVGLTCLGQAGNRKCYQLCRIGGAECGPMDECKTTSAFKDGAYGICQPQPSP
jgi:hypothetical protein